MSDPRFLQLTDTAGHPVLVNVAHILSITPAQINLTTAAGIEWHDLVIQFCHLKQSFTQVRAALNRKGWLVPVATADDGVSEESKEQS